LENELTNTKDRISKEKAAHRLLAKQHTFGIINES
jgi:hypothetical protein